MLTDSLAADIQMRWRSVFWLSDTRRGSLSKSTTFEPSGFQLRTHFPQDSIMKQLDVSWKFQILIRASFAIWRINSNWCWYPWWTVSSKLLTPWAAMVIWTYELMTVFIVVKIWLTPVLLKFLKVLQIKITLRQVMLVWRGPLPYRKQE